MLGGFMFMMMSVITPIGHFFSQLPLSVGSAVLFATYLQLFNSSFNFFKQVTFNLMNVYRAAIPLFIGIIIMTMPAESFETLPTVMQLLVNKGLLVGIFLSVVIDNVFKWEHLGEKLGRRVK